MFCSIKLESSRLPNKMLLPLGDKILCQHIFYTFKCKKKLDIDIYCFCSDNKIIEYFKRY